jgi:predicted transcriptional regulator
MTEASKVVEYIRSLPKERLGSLTYEDLLEAGIDVRKLQPKELVLIAKELRSLGLGYKRIGRILGIPVSTLYKCLKPKPKSEEGVEVSAITPPLAKLAKLYILLTLILACKDALNLIDDLLRDLGLKSKT